MVSVWATTVDGEPLVELIGTATVDLTSIVASKFDERDLVLKMQNMAEETRGTANSAHADAINQTQV